MQRSPFRCSGLLLRTLRPAILAAILALVPAALLAQGNGKLQLHHVNVGQGDGILVISPLGETALFDDGVYTNCTPIVSYLQGLGISSLKYHFTSHYHADHIGCTDDLAAAGITVAVAGWDRGYSYSSGTYTAYVNTLGNKRRTLAKNQVIRLDSLAANPVYIKCVDLNGAGVYSPTGSDENAKSAVLLVSYGSFNEVIGGDLTGDGSLDVESTVGPEAGDVEVYKVHHHGSAYSSNDNWLSATTPEVGVIQVGNGNSYGHPTAAALGRLHAHGVHTYWTQTGAGASPNPSWDKVANSAVVIQANPGAGASYTVTGTGINDTYYNGGTPPPINTTQVASSMTMIKGSITTGDVTRLAVNDAVRVSVGAGVTGGLYLTDWYGSVTLAHPPINLAITYDGNYTVSRTQTLYLWNWNTSAWVQIDQATVSTTDVTRTWSTGSPSAYVSPTREVRLRVGANTRTGSYTCRGDYMAFTYDYLPGTLRAPDTETLFASLGVGEAPSVSHERHDHLVLPQSVLRTIDVAPAASGVTLAWTTGREDHADGFNVYRENAAGERVFLGGESELEVAGDEVRFRFQDLSAEAGGTYWLGARGCSGPEGLVGPFTVAGGGRIEELAFAAGPNPARGWTRFFFALGRESEAALEIYDLSGRRVATPYSGRTSAGRMTVEWGLRGSDGAPVEPGIYFARLVSSGRTQMTRITVVGH